MIADLLRNAAKEYVEQEQVAEVVCSTIRANTPSYCTGYSWVGPHDHMPARRYDAGTWSFPTIANGCGAGGIFEAGAFQGGRSLYNWSDDMNEPVTGYSFRSACDNHDVCYSNQRDKQTCDIAFKEEMDMRCGTSWDCQMASSIYTAAVHSSVGSSAYIQAGKERTCRSIQHESAANSCH